MKKLPLILVFALLTVAIIAAAGIQLFHADQEETLDAASEFRRLYSKYRFKDTAVSMTGTIAAFDMESDGKKVEEVSFEYLQNGKEFYSRLHYTQSFFLDSNFIEVDTVNEIISVNKIENQDNIIPGPNLFESMLADTTGHGLIIDVLEENGRRVLKIRNELTPEIRECRLYYDPKTYVISMSEIEWWKNPGMIEESDKNRYWLSKIAYSGTKDQQPDLRLMLARYISHSENEIKANPDFSTYRLYMGGKLLTP